MKSYPLPPEPRIVCKGKIRFDKILHLGRFAPSPKKAADLANNNVVKVNGRQYKAWEVLDTERTDVDEFLMEIGDQRYILQPRWGGLLG